MQSTARRRRSLICCRNIKGQTSKDKMKNRHQCRKISKNLVTYHLITNCLLTCIIIAHKYKSVYCHTMNIWFLPCTHSIVVEFSLKKAFQVSFDTSVMSFMYAGVSCLVTNSFLFCKPLKIEDHWKNVFHECRTRHISCKKAKLIKLR